MFCSVDNNYVGYIFIILYVRLCFVINWDESVCGKLMSIHFTCSHFVIVSVNVNLADVNRYLIIFCYPIRDH